MSPLIHDDTDIIARLRALQPPHAMNWHEQRSVTERQAALLLKLSHVDEPPVLFFVIASLPGVIVEHRRGWPTSGMTVHAKSHWRIVLRAEEPLRRRRYTVAHELKHIIDDPSLEHIYAHLDPVHRLRRAERACDHFAACLLMPRMWIKRDWYTGLHDVRELADRYYVSMGAMTVRLRELGLHVAAPSGLGRRATDCGHRRPV